METRIRIRRGDVEVECAGDEVFITTRLPDVVSELLRRISEQPSTRTVSVAGDVTDYFTGVTIAAARVVATGLTPELSGTSDRAGRYLFSGQVAGTTCFLSVSDLSNFVNTTTGPFVVGSRPLTIRAFAIAAADLNRQYAAVGLRRSASAGTVIVHLLDASGRPLEMVPAADLSLITSTGAPAGDGPFFFGPAGDVESQAQRSVSHAFNGLARAAFLNVPQGDFSVQLVSSTGGGLQRVIVGVHVSAGASIAEAALAA